MRIAVLLLAACGSSTSYVFAVELSCDGICAPKPANPNCRLEGAGIIECKSS
jgi:hypothetical protein